MTATTGSTTDPGTIERELTIAARPETVFRFFIEPERMVRWMGRTAELDPTPGGRFRIDYNGSDIAIGSFVEVDPPRRVVFTWGWEAAGDSTPPGTSTVEVTLTPDGATGTRLRLRHYGLPDQEAVGGHAEGWDQFLPGLVSAAEADAAA
jgi:uncharacterized protein YndB with AHSA1/START domain